MGVYNYPHFSQKLDDAKLKEIEFNCFSYELEQGMDRARLLTLEEGVQKEKEFFYSYKIDEESKKININFH